jgi:hypothetical protein
MLTANFFLIDPHMITLQIIQFVMFFPWVNALMLHFVEVDTTVLNYTI